MGKIRNRTGVGVWRFLSNSEWNRSAFFVIFLESEWSRSLVSNFKIETKNDDGVKCDFDVNALVPKLWYSRKFGVGVWY